MVLKNDAVFVCIKYKSVFGLFQDRVLSDMEISSRFE